ETTSFTGSFTEPQQSGITPGNIGLNKIGRGTLVLAPSAGNTVNYLGTTFVGTTTDDGGTLVLGGNATLANSGGVTVRKNASLVLDNSTVNNADRLNDASTITLTGGRLKVIGN